MDVVSRQTPQYGSNMMVCRGSPHSIAIFVEAWVCQGGKCSPLCPNRPLMSCLLDDRPYTVSIVGLSSALFEVEGGQKGRQSPIKNPSMGKDAGGGCVAWCFANRGA